MRALLPLLLFAVAPPDIAPNPRHRAGIDLAPRESTAVAMRAEVVEITVHSAHAEVRAVFDLENTSDAAEALEVGFPTKAHPSREPIADGLRFPNPFLDTGTIYAFVAEVDGAEVTAAQKSVDKEDPRQEHRDWVCWPMSFAAGQRRRVEVRYEVETRDATYVRPYGRLQPREVTYVLKTGAGWKDAIGSARVLLRCADDVAFDLVERTTPAPHEKREKEWEWLFENFEPTEDITIRYRAYRDAADAIARIEPLLKEKPDDAELLLDWAENKAELGEHAAAAAVFVRLARWKRLEMPKPIFARLYDRPAQYLAARSHHLAGDTDAARRWMKEAFDVLRPRLEGVRTDSDNPALRERLRDLRAGLEKTQAELERLRAELQGANR